MIKSTKSPKEKLIKKVNEFANKIIKSIQEGQEGKGEEKVKVLEALWEVIKSQLGAKLIENYSKKCNENNSNNQGQGVDNRPTNCLPESLSKKNIIGKNDGGTLINVINYLLKNSSAKNLATAEKEIKKQKNMIDAINQEIQTNIKQIEELRVENKRLANNLKEFEESKKLIEQENATLLQDKAEALKISKEQEAKTNLLNDECNREKNDLTNKINSLTKVKEDLSSQVSSLLDENNILKARLAQNLEEKNKLEKQNLKNIDSLNELKGKITEFEEQKNQILDDKTNLLATDCNENNKKLEKDITDKEKRIQDYEETLKLYDNCFSKIKNPTIKTNWDTYYKSKTNVWPSLTSVAYNEIESLKSTNKTLQQFLDSVSLCIDEDKDKRPTTLVNNPIKIPVAKPVDCNTFDIKFECKKQECLAEKAHKCIEKDNILDHFIKCYIDDICNDDYNKKYKERLCDYRSEKDNMNEVYDDFFDVLPKECMNNKLFYLEYCYIYYKNNDDFLKWMFYLICKHRYNNKQNIIYFKNLFNSHNAVYLYCNNKVNKNTYIALSIDNVAELLSDINNIQQMRLIDTLDALNTFIFENYIKLDTRKVIVDLYCQIILKHSFFKFDYGMSHYDELYYSIYENLSV